MISDKSTAETPVSAILTKDINAKDQEKFRKDAMATITLKDSLNQLNNVK